MINEVWKDIEGFEGAYQVSNYGRIKSLKRTIVIKKKNGITQHIIIGGVYLKSIKHNRGYLVIDLSKNNKRTRLFIHRLVGFAFIKNPNNYLEINHIDFDKTNNQVDNLEWCSRMANAGYKEYWAYNKRFKKTKEEIDKDRVRLGLIKKQN